MIKAIIFDLDNCIAASREVGDSLFDPAFDAIRKANGPLSDAQLKRAFADCWTHPVDWVAEHHGFTDEMLAAGWREFEQIEVHHPMRGYDDLQLLCDLPGKRFLVTSGFRRLQESKIRALQLEPYFDALYVDALGEENRTGKRGLFEQIARDERLACDEVLVVGDNPESEIEAGRQLGMRTVQTLRPGVSRSDKADFHVRTFSELADLIARLPH